MNKPSVSIVVVTYNSSRFVVETLESAYNQNYEGPIELIVSDDGSTDGTIDICRQWVRTHSDRFVKCQVIKTPINLGICGNYNFALEHVGGEWIKYIAGDDILMPECIDEFVDVSLQSDDKFFLSGVCCFDPDGNTFPPRYLMKEYLDDPDPFIQAENLAAHAKFGIVEGPTFFINTELLRSMGGMDIKYPMLEDFPFAFRCAFMGHHIGVIKKPLVKYRVYPESISNSKDYFRQMYDDAMYDARARVAFRNKSYLEWWHHHVMKHTVRLSDNKRYSNQIKSYIYKLSDVYAHAYRIRRVLGISNV